MSSAQISILTFTLAIATIALTGLILMIVPKAHWIWKTGLFINMALLGAGTVLIFVPYYNRYAALTGMAGVFIAYCAVAYDRFTKSAGQQFAGGSRFRLLLYSFAFFVVMGAGGSLFFKLLSNQDEVKSKQLELSTRQQRAEEKIDVLICMLERENADRLAQHKRDSTERASINQVVRAVDTKVSRSLKNDVDVKVALKGTSKRNVSERPNLFFTPAPKGVPPTSFTLPGTEHVKPPASVPLKPRKVRQGKYSYLEEEQEDAQPVARSNPPEN